MLTTPFGEFPNRFLRLHFSTAFIFPEFVRSFNRFVHKNLLKVPLGENWRDVKNPLCFWRGNVNPLSVSCSVGEE